MLLEDTSSGEHRRQQRQANGLHEGGGKTTNLDTGRLLGNLPTRTPRTHHTSTHVVTQLTRHRGKQRRHLATFRFAAMLGQG